MDGIAKILVGPRHHRYAVMQQVSQGAHGEVHLGVDRITNARVAIKKQDLAGASGTRELATLSALGAFPHPNVIIMKDYYVIGQHIYTVYDCYPTTLWHIWKAHDCQFQQLCEQKITSYMLGVARGLNHLHRHGIVHGDATLANMLVSEAGNVLVADMGSAHSCHGYVVGDSVQLTTLYVRAPEKLLGQVSTTERIDTWAIGVQLLALFTGKIPWLECRDPTHAFDMIMEKLLGPVLSSWGGHEELPMWRQVQANHDSFQKRHLLDKAWNFEKRFNELHDRPPGDAKPVCDALRSMLAWNPVNRISMEDVLRLPLFACGALQAAAPPTDLSKRRRTMSESLASETSKQALESSEGGEQAGLEQAGLRPTSSGLTGLRPTLDDAGGKREADDAGGQRAPVDEALAPAAVAIGGDLCQCSGNCGWKVCNNRQYRRIKHQIRVCVSTCAPGYKFCIWCKCCNPKCGGPRSKTEKCQYRWCKKCAPQHKMTAKQWVKSDGTLIGFKPGLPVPCKVMLRMLWVLRLLWPTDLQVCLQVIAFFEPKLGEPVGHICIVITFLAQTIKWPPAVAHFLRLVQCADLKSIDSDVDVCSRVFTIYVDVIAWCDGKVWGDMFDRMHGKSSRLDAISGLNNSAKFMGVIAKADTGGTFALGRGQSLYNMADEESIVAAKEVFTFMFQRAQRVKTSWPSSKEDTHQFAESLLAFAREVRSFKLGGDGAGLPGGRDPEHMYNAKSWVRMMLLQCLQMLPSALDKHTLLEISEWSPDEKKRLKQWESMTGRQIQEEFDIDPLMFSCWLCMINMCMDPKGMESALKFSDSELHEVADQYRKDSVQTATDSLDQDASVFAPGPHIITETINKARL